MQLHFAPLQGYTTAHYRKAHHHTWGGVDCYYTPFVRIEKGGFRHRDLTEIARQNNEGIEIVPQMLPQNGNEVRQIAQLFIDNGYRRADINMGCPFPPVALHKRGSGLLPHPDAVADVLHATLDFPQLQFSLKMRPGWQEPNEWRAIIDIINATPLQHVTMHPRIGKIQYKGEANRALFKEFLDCCTHPVIYNGDLTTLDDVRAIKEDFGSLHGIMIGRGLLARPYLSMLLSCNETPQPHDIIERTKRFHDTLYNHLQETSQGHTQLMQRALAMWQYFLPQAPRKERKAVLKASSPARYEQAVASLFDRWSNACEIEL